MSMDTSLKSKSTLQRHRNVLSRAERIAILKDTGLWVEGRATGLPKVAHRKATVGKKSKDEKKVAGAEAAPSAGAEGAAAPAAEGAKPVAGKAAAGKAAAGKAAAGKPAAAAKPGAKPAKG